MAKTAKEKPTDNTGTKTKKSTSRKTGSGNSTKNELPSSPRSRGECAAHCGALLNPTDVDDPALSAVNPSLSEINYDVASPGAARAEANAIGDNIFFDKKVGKGMNLAYNSNNEDYRGDVYDDDYSDGEESLAKYRVPSAQGKGAGHKPKAGQPPKPGTKRMSAQNAFTVMSHWERTWKRDNDANRGTAAAAAALKYFDESLDHSGDHFTGVCSRTLWEMKAVELHPLRKGDTFPNKEIVML
jgi:hypothetical protein